MRLRIADFRWRIEGATPARSIRNPKSAIRNAFTLIELITALSMTAILAVSLYTSLRTAFRAQASAEAAVEPVRTADLAMELLREDIQNALPPTGDLANYFAGTDGTDSRGALADSLLFYTTAESKQHAAANGEIKKVELLISAPANTNDHLLVRRVTRNLLATVEPEPDEEVICRGVAGFNLRYYDGSEWMDTWDSATSIIPMPLAVEVMLQLDRTPAGGGETRPLRYLRVFPLSCATPLPPEELE